MIFLEIMGIAIVYMVIGILIALITEDTYDYWSHWGSAPPHPILRVAVFPGSVVCAMIGDLQNKKSRYHSRPGIRRKLAGPKYLLSAVLLWPFKLAWNVAVIPAFVIVLVWWVIGATKETRLVSFTTKKPKEQRQPSHLW